MGLPIITNTEPRSLSYFKYAKNAMKVGDLNPNYSAVQMPYHPYHLPSNTDPLYKSQQLLNNPNVGEHPYLNTYPLPPIGKNKENNLKAIKSGELVVGKYLATAILGFIVGLISYLLSFPTIFIGKKLFK